MHNYAFVTRFGHQSLVELMGRRPTQIEYQIYFRALEEIVTNEHKVDPLFRPKA